MLAVVGCVFLFLAVTRLGIIYGMRKECGLESADLLKDREIASEVRLPPEILFTFRSLAINYLWTRAEDLKDEGQYFDALHLARMICALQPYLPTVWDFQAWNMSYNISVSLPTPAERWQWVRAGYELLRDKGLLYNPKSLKIYNSLSWIFQHKMGGDTDDYHRYYKLRLAMEMMPLLTAWHKPLLSRCQAEDIAELAESPKKLEELVGDEKVSELLGRMIEIEPRFSKVEDVLAEWVKVRTESTRFSPEFHQFLADNRDNKALSRLDAFIRSRILRQEWKLEPKEMQAINNKYGPVDYEDENIHYSLDWRLPFVHSLYWACEGLKYSKGKYDIDENALHRGVYHNLQYLYNYGNMRILPFAVSAAEAGPEADREVTDAPQQIQLQLFNSQDLRMFPIAYQATLDLIKSSTEGRGRAIGGVSDGSENLAMSGIVSLYLAGHVKMAQKYLNHLRQKYPEDQTYQVENLEVFVREQMREQFASLSPKYASNYIIEMLRSAYFYFATGDPESANIRQKWAEQVLDVLKKEWPDEQDRISRLKLLPFEDMQWVALLDFLRDGGVDPNIKGYLMGWLKNMKPQVYDRVMEELDKQKAGAEEGPIDKGAK